MITRRASWTQRFHPTALIVSIVWCVPCAPALAQDIDGILGASPVQVQSENPVSNGNLTEFGAAVALDGDLLVVGAPNEDSSTAANDFDTGAVYVFERVGLDWVQQQKLTAPTEIASEEFGSSVGVALGDEGLDYLIVGAPGFDGARGRAYFFNRTNGGPWQFEVFHTQEEPDPGDRFGGSVAIDFFEPPNSPTGDSVFVVVVGSATNRGPLPGDAQNGSISIFQRSGGPPTWGRTHEFFGELNDLLGSSVAMAEHNIVAGAEGLDEAGFNAGGGRIFTQGNFDGTVYQYAAGKLLVPSDPVAGGIGLGTVAATHYRPFVDENVAALGAPLADDGAFNAGKVYLYDLSTGAPGTSLIESATLQAPGTPASGNFGTSIALWGSLAAVGAPGPGIGGDGKVFLFERGASLEEWNYIGELAPPDLPPVGSCAGGTDVALGEAMAAVGCPATSLIDNRAVFMYVSGTIFTNGFESGGLGEWSEAYP